MKLSAETLQPILDKGDAKACLALFKGADEKARRAVAGLAQKHLKSIEPFIQTSPSTLVRNKLLDAAEVAVFATGTMAELLKAGWRGMPDVETAYQIMAERRPPWLGDWANAILADNAHHWPLVRLLIRNKLCQRPTTDNYWLGMLGHHIADFGRFHNVKDAFLADPELLGEIWKLFEIEGNGEWSLAARDKYSAPERTFATGFIELAKAGKLPRGRLLDASLDALARGFAQFRAGWFSRFHEALQPTLAERAARTERYLHLLGSNVPPTVSFALNALGLLDKAGKLPAAVVVEHIEPAMLARAKQTVRAALKLLESAVQADNKQAARAARRAARALGHEVAEVQAAALAFLEKHGRSDDAELVEIVQEQAAGLAASQKKRLADWLGASLPAAPAADAPDDGALEKRARKIPAALRKLAGVDAARAAVKCGQLAPALDFEGTEFPRLHADAALTPIATLDELIERITTVLEDAGDADEVECVLDGVSRLCGDRPADFAVRVGPIRKRAQTLIKRGAAEPTPELCDVVLSWTTDEKPKPIVRRRSLLDFLSQRALEVARRAHAGQPAPLLAAPTHRGGWIDPRVLAARAAKVGRQADVVDQVQALLRLAPDHRADALKRASKLEGEFGAALRHALGADRITIGPTAALWAAAARARSPFHDDPVVLKKFPKLGRDAGQAARYRYQIKQGQHRPSLEVACAPAAPRAAPVELALALEQGGWIRASIRWAASVWPLAREAHFAAAADLIGNNLDWWESDWSHRLRLEPLLDPDVPLKPMAVLLLTLGLVVKEPGISGLATDALIAAIDDGRLDAVRLSETMSPLLHGGLIKPTRAAATLGTAARASPLHVLVIRDAIVRLLDGDPKKPPRDLHALLEVLKELVNESGQELDRPAARRYLEGLGVAGKTGKLARELLQFQGHGSLIEAARRALLGRLERAERWQR